jgi:hypothetical protein
MSISEPRTNIDKPTKKYIQLKNGNFQYYDKEKGENVEVALPVEFIVCDELATIKGWNDEQQAGIYSNEVRNTTREELVVRCKGQEIVKGIYQDIKGKLDGGRYAKSVYAVAGGELVNFCFVGASLSAWIEKVVEVAKPKFTVNEFIDGKKGATKYKIPVFEVSEATEEEWEEAKKIDKEILQPYFKKLQGEPTEKTKTIPGVEAKYRTEDAASDLENGEHLDPLPF